MSEPALLRRVIEDFSSRVILVRPVAAIEVTGTLLSDYKAWLGHDWAHEAGIYVVFQSITPKYVGRALKGNGLARRLHEHLRSRTSGVRAVLEQPNAALYVVSLHNDDAWLAPSLELLAQAHLRNPDMLNKKRS